VQRTVGGTWILCTLRSVLTLAIEAVQATPLHISQHIDAAIIISTERAAASARRERHVRRPCPADLTTVQRLLSATLFNNSPLALPAIPIKFALFVHQSSILVNQFVLFHHQHHHHLLRPPSTQLPRSPTWLPYAHLNKHPAHLLPLSSSPLTSPHLPPNTHTLFPSRLPRPLPYALSSLTVRLCVLPHLKLPLVCSFARMTRPTPLRLTLPPPAPLPSCPSRRI
jgi:hypothetical protein